VIGKDGDKLQKYYSDLFGWDVSADNEMKYRMVAREGNVSPDSVGIGGGIAGGPPDTAATSRSTSPCRTSRPRSQGRGLGGTRIMGPEKIMDMVEAGPVLFPRAT
jgi:hypothetical protein